MENLRRGPRLARRAPMKNTARLAVVALLMALHFWVLWYVLIDPARRAAPRTVEGHRFARRDRSALITQLST